MLEVATVVWASNPMGEPITSVERIKLSEELLNYRQRGNGGLMSFEDFAAWHSRIPQALAGMRSLRQKQRAARSGGNFNTNTTTNTATTTAAPPSTATAPTTAAPTVETSDPLGSMMSSIGSTLGLITNKTARVSQLAPAPAVPQHPAPAVTRTRHAPCRTFFSFNSPVEYYFGAHVLVFAQMSHDCYITPLSRAHFHTTRRHNCCHHRSQPPTCTPPPIMPPSQLPSILQM